MLFLYGSYSEAEVSEQLKRDMRIVNCICLFFIITFTAVSQEDTVIFRGSIPEELLRPARGEALRYPSDIVIGELGRGRASAAAFSFANTLASGFLSLRMDHPSIASINQLMRESYLSTLDTIEPESFRLGGGREEADGAISFLIRFIGKEYGITGELYIRHIARQVTGDDGEITNVSYWVFEDLLLEEAVSREMEQAESSRHRNDFSPYERFY